MVERLRISPVGCFGHRAWQEPLAQAQTILADLGLDPALGAVAHRVARLVPTAASLPAFWLLLGVLVSESEGHSRVNLDGPAWPEPLAKAMGPWEPLREALLAGPLAVLVGPQERPLVVNGPWLSSQRLHASETRVALAVRTRLRQAQRMGQTAEPVLLDPVRLNAEQQRAVALALTAPLTLITGRPGTGKTSIVVALLRSLQRQAPPLALDRILLAAPTGKAAQRMGEALRRGLEALGGQEALDQHLRQETPEPQTLHRALGYHPGLGGYRHNAAHPLAADFVIVDEASMIGLELLEGLLEALAPGTQLVLLGDAEQLPSVDPGTAFRDLVAHLPETTVILKESYRMDPHNPRGRHILLQAERINQPALTSELWGAEGLRQGALEDAIQQGGVWLLEPQAPKRAWMAAFLKRWLRERIWAGEGAAAWQTRVLAPIHATAQGWVESDRARALALLAHFDGFRLLCPVNEGPELGGVEPLNEHLHALALETAGAALAWQPRFLAGEPVLVLANDSTRGLFNGDQGVILPVQRGEGSPHLEALFPRGDGLVGFPLASLQDSLTHAYALTVHKAQGSEFKSIALVLPPADHPALTREVLYTALTRAREEVLLLGTAAAVEAACARTVARRSGLGERLDGPYLV